MKLLSILILTLSTSFAFAETATYKVGKMHCGGCADMIKEKVSKLEGVTSCDVKLVDEKKQTGEMTITTAKGVAINFEKLKAAVADTGDYTLTPVVAKK